ncbi:MAG: thiamine-phosphate kinase, partial [Leptolyngbya sp. SIO3F4]|nr:thiamine-phosphate kinase [Leptolyngbya sp. SIO3F4]
ICTQSHIGANLLCSQLPIPSGLNNTVDSTIAQQWTLYGGEDFELVLSLPSNIAKSFIQTLPSSQIIGHTTAESGIRLIDDVHQGPDIYLDQSLGYQHFG